MTTFNSGVSTTLAARSFVDLTALEYQTAFDLLPDGAGLTFQVGLLSSGALTPIGLAEEIAASPEFATVHAGETTSQIITDFYNNDLGRAPDASGLAFWVGEVNHGVNLGDVMYDILNSPESLTFNSNGLSRFETSAALGAVGDQAPIDNSPLTTTTTGGTTGTTTTTTTTVFVPDPIPTAEAHDVTHAEHQQAPLAFTNPNGTLTFSSGAPSNDMSAVIDNTSGFQFYFDVHPRQDPVNYSPTTITTSANGVVSETFVIAGGTENNPYGVNSTRADGSLDFAIGGAPGALLNPDYQLTFSTSGPTGSASGHIAVTSAGVQSWIVDASTIPGLAVGANIIGDDPASTTVASNSVNLAFAEFGGNPNAVGTYTFEVDLVKVVGLSAPVTVAGFHANIIASAPVMAL